VAGAAPEPRRRRALYRLPLGHEARASVGVRLAILGDRRPGVGLCPDGLPDIEWCRVDGGEVTIEIRANPDDSRSEVVDRLTCSVEPFRIARYPVTVTQFQRFLDECHREGRWQLPPGFPLEVPADYAPPRHRARHGNHPADAVNWWDAMLLCHWLGARLGHDELALRLTRRSGPRRLRGPIKMTERPHNILFLKYSSSFC
jgi:hypothetical protein